ncbi:ATP-binding protein [Corynebacterium mastitidis]|uniref:ATP-binding protein n=1 Tax=Corynebacterium mastitidis TaxID=161890 RepID=UPI001F24D34B|nr:ATP-binding protein [Corynebacterium mastitidis]MCH6196129.1 ATP-binding protein [Corynebacterium mastitidis]
MRYLHWWHGSPAGAAQSLSSHLSPAVIAGRENERHQFELVLAEGPGNPWRTALISGSRGIGKTVLLNELEDVAQAQGWLVLRAHVGPRMLLDLVEVTIPRVYDALDDAPTPRRRTLTGVSLSHLGSVSMAAERTRPLPGRNLLSELQDLAEVTAPRGVGIAITVDEVQSADHGHLHELAVAIQDLNRDDADIAFLAAGLPSGVEDLLQLSGTTFLAVPSGFSLIGSMRTPPPSFCVRRRSSSSVP